MSSSMCAFVLLFICFPSQVDGVHQSPPQIVEENTTVTISCSHDDTSRPVMLWYQQRESHSQSIILIGFGYGGGTQSYEGQFEEEFELKRESTLKGALIIRRASPVHSAVYFCAASGQGYYEPAYFGGGTKLTVLDSNHTVTLPKVKVLKPSKKECERKGKTYKKKTLVCLVYGFYPDHVNVFWLIDGVKVTDGVATDNTAQKAGQHYNITSRLTVGLREWLTEGANFTCAVEFFRGNGTVQCSDWIIGVDDRVNRDKYLRITNNAKLSYAVLIIKSSIYGVFVVFLVWWLQRSPGKQND